VTSRAASIASTGASAREPAPHPYLPGLRVDWTRQVIWPFVPRRPIAPEADDRRKRPERLRTDAGVTALAAHCVNDPPIESLRKSKARC
jgi:hypothetical protein